LAGSSCVIRRALLSVWDKTGICELAAGLHEMGVKLIASGGTARSIRQAGLPVMEVSQLTGFPEILDGRVKTLHPKIFGGLLALDTPEHRLEMEREGLWYIDLVAVNLYPFREVAWQRRAELDEALEHIDIGGSALLRAAAKNFPRVVVLSSPEQYQPVLEELRSRGDLTADTRRRLAWAAFRHSSIYDAWVTAYLGMGKLNPQEPVEGDGELLMVGARSQVLPYGENPHQKAALYLLPGCPPGALSRAQLLAGRPLSYNNYLDAAAALALVVQYEEPAAVAIKHASPCGCAVATELSSAFRACRDADPVSIFGGVVAVNREVDEDTARGMREVHLDLVVAPGYSPSALQLLKRRRRLRVLRVTLPQPTAAELRTIPGGLLLQEPDAARVDPTRWQLVTSRKPTEDELADAVFAWRVVRVARSNAVVVARGRVTLGIGAGQPSRISAARLALAQAGERARGAVMASDGFLPFPDVVQAAAAAGVTCLVQPGGSVRDEESVAAAEQAGLSMLFTGVRHFRH